MFKETVCVEIINNKSSYRERAENLGYKFYTDLSTRFGVKARYIILFSESDSLMNERNYSITNRLPYNFKNIISEKEFFGETMLKKIDLEILSVLVSLVCDKLNAFSAYDITSILRSRLKDFNIKHEEVKTLVKNYANSKLLTPFDNGTYIIYSKNNFNTKQQNSAGSDASVTVGISTVYDPMLSNIKQAIKESTETKLDKLLKEKNSSAKSNTSKILPLQSEGRVNITELIKAHFPKDRFVYVKRDKNANKVIISNIAQADTTKVLIGEEVRIRTGFYGSNNVKVNFLKNVVEVTPY